ncbi:protein mono-ADP-ribosyltransferase PARP8-like [Halichondria panicea]|uniref:protein mono-ADP-ribosyltransferase PARP8-like n=1 Tax=Halichondria panicea TaxID=6063 RepID=UPI00312BC271
MATQRRRSQEMEELIFLCATSVYTKLLECSEDTVAVLLEHPTNSSLNSHYTILTGADYPDGVVVCQEGGGIRSVSESAEWALKSLVSDWCRERQLTIPESFQLDCLQLNTQVSVASSEYTTDASDFDDDDFDSYDGYETEDTLHPLIEEDVIRVQQLFGRNSIETRIHAGIDEMDIFFNIDLNNFMDENIALAWGVKVREPLVIMLHVRTMSKYLNGVEPKVEVFQSPTSSKVDRKKVAIGNQLKKIIENFVASQWKNLSNADIEKNRVDLDTSASDVDLSSACAGLEKPGELGTLVTSPQFSRQDSLGAQMRSPEGSEESDPMACKKLPGLENGFLVQCLQYGLNRICTLNEFCVICDERHIIETGLIKPCVCTRELCVFAFQTLGVMADAAEAIATDGDVVDLLIAMANAAATNPRAKIIFDPFPSILNPDNPNELALNPKKQDFRLVCDVLKEVVNTRELMLAGRCQSTGVKEELDSHHRLAFPLMQWIIATCRAHIVLLPEDRRIKAIKTKYQFVLISSPPAKEAAFQAAKTKSGSTFAFHGSNIENWHSIMRKGLINASGTKLQLHGAAHGSGVYLSPSSNVSFGYMGNFSAITKPKPPGGRESLVGKVNLKCMALCEVVTSKNLNKSGDIWVCPNSDHVCTRFFFVFDKDQNHKDPVDTRQPKYREQIDHAMEHISKFRRVK